MKTASRVINGERYVTAETRDKVLKAAGELGFVPNALASALARGMTSHSISLITGDLSNPFYAAIATGVENELRGHDIHLTLASSGEDDRREVALIEEFALRRSRAILLVSTVEDHSGLETIQRRGIPIVFLDRAPSGLVADSFVIDNSGGTRAAIEQLISFGHRRIGYIGDYKRIQTHQTRFGAYTAAMLAAGLDWESFAVRDAHNPDAAESLARELLASADPPTALFAANNRATVGCLRAVKDHRCPVALIGFDDFELADVLGVTTVANDPVALGRAAARKVLDTPVAALAAPTGSTTVIPTTLVRRGSGEIPSAD
jgi:LacI family transcriptional regulator